MPAGHEITDEAVHFFLRVARRMAALWCDSDDIDDIAQDAVIRLLSRPMQPDKPIAWLYVVTRRLSHRQRRRRHTQSDAEDAFARRFSASVDPELLLDVSSLLSQLNVRDRHLLTRVVEGAFSSELAMEFHCKIRDVGQMVSRARRRARKLRDRTRKG